MNRGSLSANHANGHHLLGDACEDLMRHFATESGKSKGQFYTPAEVSHDGRGGGYRTEDSAGPDDL